MKFYRLNEILKLKATYYMIFGERSNGKTFAVLEHILKKYCEKKEQGVIVRREKEDIVGNNGKQLFENLVVNGVVKELTKGKWDYVEYKSSAFYLAKFDDKLDKVVLDREPFAHAICLSGSEHKKSIAFPKVTTIFFDEFISRTRYLQDEFVLFMNLISTIVRFRDNVEIFMCANTVNRECIYFKEMGLRRVKQQKQGTIDVYHFGESKLKVAVEYTSISDVDGKPSDVYFAFDNPKLNMITSGAWEVALYPHCPCKYKPKDVKFNFFILFSEEILHGEIVIKGKERFIYIHRKTTPLKNPDKDLIYSTDVSPRKNWSRRIIIPRNKIENEIVKFFKEEKVFYQDNEVGETVNAYIDWCKRTKI